jgi:RND superfamily putative drug exporter
MMGTVQVIALAFGLSMDYQVFMLSRFREEYEHTGDNTAAVAIGLERTGRVVTYAAICISLVFMAWLTSGLSYTKAVGLGLPLAVLMDATLVRGALLPAFMKLTGRANWWAPGPLRRLPAGPGPPGPAPPGPAVRTAGPARTDREECRHVVEWVHRPGDR